MNQSPIKPTTFAIWQHCLNLFETQPAPAIWFDLRPDRRVRINTWRRSGASQPSSFRLGRLPRQKGV